MTENVDNQNSDGALSDKMGPAALFYLLDIPFIPQIPDTSFSWVGIRMKQFPVQWMYWSWVLKVALDFF